MSAQPGLGANCGLLVSPFHSAQLHPSPGTTAFSPAGLGLTPCGWPWIPILPASSPQGSRDLLSLTQGACSHSRADLRLAFLWPTPGQYFQGNGICTGHIVTDSLPRGHGGGSPTGSINAVQRKDGIYPVQTILSHNPMRNLQCHFALYR